MDWPLVQGLYLPILSGIDSTPRPPQPCPGQMGGRWIALSLINGNLYLPQNHIQYLSSSHTEIIVLQKGIRYTLT